MKAPEEKILIDGPAGRIEVIMERPDAPRGIALIAHPHPMGGGANTNKVAYTLARTFVSLGYASFRPNFRGVGGSEGVMTKAAAKPMTCWPCSKTPNAAAATCRWRSPASLSAPTPRRASPDA